MKKTILSPLPIVALFYLAGCGNKPTVTYSSFHDPSIAPQLKQFASEKELQAGSAAKGGTAAFRDFFAAAEKGDWSSISNRFADLEKHAGSANDQRPRGTAWEAVKEVWGGWEAFADGDEKYALAFGNDIINSIPPGSIYFGGTDPGRFIVTAMCKSQVNADPFFVLTQNALADGTYLDYLREMYGQRIYVPTSEDSQRCFQDYVEDVTKRQKNNLLKPGENVKTDGGRVQVSGQVAVMEVNGLLVKTIFDNNPNHEFYIEESFPLDWMYPCLEPHGLIMKLNRQPLARLSKESVLKDHEYWAGYIQPMIGDWLGDDTSVEQIASFAKKAFGNHDFAGFTADQRFIRNAYSHKMFSKLRSSQAGLYVWRMKNTADSAEKEEMAVEADYAFRQAWAMCPYSPEAVYRYVNFLIERHRGADAGLVAETAAQMPSMKGAEGQQLRTLAAQLKKLPH